MQDLTGLTAGMSNSEITDPTSPRIAVPDDVAHSILLQLDTQDYSTVFTILTCRLVSRSFDAAAHSASVWRPLVQQRWKTGEPEYTILPNASDQTFMDLAIDPLDPPVHPRAIFRARTLVDRIALAAAARRGDSVEKTDRIESYDTIAMLGTQVYDAIIRFKTVSPEERHDYLAIRRVAHELEPTLTRGISMELWRDASDEKRSERVTLDAMYKSFAPFGTPWKTFDEIESGLQRLADYCYQHIWLDQTDTNKQGINVSPAYLVAESVWNSLFRLGYKVLAAEDITEQVTYPSSSCHLSALLDVASFPHLGASAPPDRLLPEISAAILIAAVVERLPAPYTMKTRLHLATSPRVAIAAKDDPLGTERWFHCCVSGGRVKEEREVERSLAGKPENVRRATLDSYLPSDVCLAMTDALVESRDIHADGDRRIFSYNVFSFSLALLPTLTANSHAESGFPSLISLEELIATFFYVHPTDAFLVRKHFHALLSNPTHLRDFDRTFMEFLPRRKTGSIYFKSESTPVIRRKVKGLLDFEVGEACIFRPRFDEGGDEFGVVVGWDLAEARGDDLVSANDTLEKQKSRLGYHVITETSGIEASPDVLRRLKPSEQRDWEAASRTIDKCGLLGEWFSSLSSLEYPTYVKTKAWAAIYPDE